MFEYLKRKMKMQWTLACNRVKKMRFSSRSRKISGMVRECGDNLEVFGKPEIAFPKKLSIGKNCKINSCVYVNARSGVSIGNNVTLSHGAKIISTGYDIDKFFSAGERIHKEDNPIIVGDYVWVCTNAIILPGVHINGHHVIIAAGAVVTGDINENYVIVAGCPARIISRKEK